MFLNSIKVPASSEFAGHPLVMEVAISLALNHQGTPLPEYQQTLLQLLPYLPFFYGFDRFDVIRDIYYPAFTRRDVVEALARRGARLRVLTAKYNPSVWKRLFDGTCLSLNRAYHLSVPAKLRALLWYATVLYVTDCSKVILLVQMISMFLAFFMFQSRAITGPRLSISAALLAVKCSLDFMNPFDVGSSSIIVGAIASVFTVAMCGIIYFSHTLAQSSDDPFNDFGFQYFGGLLIAAFGLTGAIWLF